MLEATQIEFPKPEIKEFTVRQVYDAMEKNGWEWLRGQWFSDKGFSAACIMGQAAINLGVVPSDEWVENENVTIPFERQEWFSSEQWDEERSRKERDFFAKWDKYSLYGQIEKLKVSVKSKWRIEDSGAASTIIRWNDAREEPQNYDSPYKLKTYKEVSDMAYDILKPHFDKVIKLATYDYGQ